ncbi:MAG TPA: FAD-binding oxidoreductase [Bryobacteraceae bacterium]|nr:FAD-binding oxidoreductase [Bryobacteraceae bacterium]
MMLPTSKTHVRGIVVARRELTADLWIVRIRSEDPLEFIPGQYVTIGLPVDSRLIERPYSLASEPADPELEFFLELVPHGKLSPHLYDTPVGGEVWLRRAAKGRFQFDCESGRRNHFMAATVTGVAPFVSMLRSLVRQSGHDVAFRITLLHAASFAPELGYREELAALAARENWFTYIPTISRVWLDPGWRAERGRIEDVARKHLDALEFKAPCTTAYLCGNPHMIRAMKGVLERAGFDKTQVREEIYWPAA